MDLARFSSFFALRTFKDLLGTVFCVNIKFLGRSFDFFFENGRMLKWNHQWSGSINENTCGHIGEVFSTVETGFL